MNRENYKAFHQHYLKLKAEFERKLFEEYKYYERLYLNDKIPTHVIKGVSEITDPIAYELIEHKLSHLITDVPNTEIIPKIDPYNMNERDDVIKARILNTLINFQLSKKSIGFLQKIRQHVKIASIYGTSFNLMSWKYDKQNKIDEPELIVLNPFRCFPDLEAESDDKMRFFIYEDYLSWEEILKFEKEKKLLVPSEKLKEFLRKYNKFDYTENNFNIILEKENLIFEPTLKVLKVFTPEKWLILLANDGQVIFEMANPVNSLRLPIAILRNIEMPFSFFGISDLYFIEGLIQTTNQMINYRMFNIKNIVEPKYKATAAAAQAYGHTWKNEPDQIFIVDNINDIQPFIIPDATAGTFLTTMNYINDTISRRLGRVDYITRTEANKFKTATEINQMKVESNARKKLYLELINEFTHDIIYQMIKFNSAFINENTIIELDNNFNDFLLENDTYTINDKKYLLIRPEYLKGDYDFKISKNISYSLEKQERLMILEKALNLLLQVKPVYDEKGLKLNLDSILKEYLFLLGNFNINEIIEKNINFGNNNLNSLINTNTVGDEQVNETKEE
ncbi:MAG: hypothetical protein NZZ41_04300 [Candidatus Dojkabacteria bacterium]|nr:hypothetical protein [Candidatus Dojkabacteria bacterium]